MLYYMLSESTLLWILDIWTNIAEHIYIHRYITVELGLRAEEHAFGCCIIFVKLTSKSNK